MSDELPRIDTSVALVVCDDTGAIVDWSDAAATLFGWSASSLLGRYLDAVVPDAHTDAAWRLYEAAMADAEAATGLDGRLVHLPIACSDGETRVFAARLAVLRDPAGAPCAGAVTFTGPVDAEPFSPTG